MKLEIIGEDNDGDIDYTKTIIWETRTNMYPL